MSVSHQKISSKSHRVISPPAVVRLEGFGLLWFFPFAYKKQVHSIELYILVLNVIFESFKDQKYWFEAEAAIALLGIFHLHDTKTSRKKKQDRPQNSNFAFLK